MTLTVNRRVHVREMDFSRGTYVNGRYLFTDTVEGAEASMGIYTIVEMAELHSLDPYKYILESRPDYKSSDEELEKLAPWSDRVQEICR